ncbi:MULTISPECIES: hypothetical protein [unclassified Sporosarcina]|uniref:hypothetical protein n=1 Tax=unclassified Sporosarcina TaxID=2647733 RepID=UPI00118088A8|nr:MULTISPECIES: hypothetical protein [unclassified Sporosarcina]
MLHVQLWRFIVHLITAYCTGSEKTTFYDCCGGGFGRLDWVIERLAWRYERTDRVFERLAWRYERASCGFERLSRSLSAQAVALSACQIY